MLKGQISNYKKVLLAVSTKYTEMEENMKKKAMSDHMVDVLRLEIKELN